MIEALVGVIFAACFVTIYFLISLLRRGDGRGQTRWPELYPTALRGTDTTEAAARLFKTADELGRHHLSSGASSAPKMIRGGTDRTS